HVQIDADPEPRGPTRSDAQGFVAHRVETAPADFLDVKHAHAKPVEALLLLGLVASHPDQSDVLGIHRASRQAVEIVVALSQKPSQRHAVQPAGVARPGRMAVHVGVDPDEAELALEHARDPGPRSACASMVAADHARQVRLAHGGRDRPGERSAELSHPRPPAPFLGRGMQHRPEQDVGTAARKLCGEERNQRRGSLGIAGIGAPEAPSRADQLDLSLHRYTKFRQTTTPKCVRTPNGKHLAESNRNLEMASSQGMNEGMNEGMNAAATTRWQQWTSFGLGLWLAMSPWICGYADDQQFATGNAAFMGIALALASHFEASFDPCSAEWL